MAHEVVAAVQPLLHGQRLVAQLWDVTLTA
jgi:hypothetical protein